MYRFLAYRGGGGGVTIGQSSTHKTPGLALRDHARRRRTPSHISLIAPHQNSDLMFILLYRRVGRGGYGVKSGTPWFVYDRVRNVVLCCGAAVCGRKTFNENIFKD